MNCIIYTITWCRRKYFSILQILYSCFEQSRSQISVIKIQRSWIYSILSNPKCFHTYSGNVLQNLHSYIMISRQIWLSGTPPHPFPPFEIALHLDSFLLIDDGNRMLFYSTTFVCDVRKSISTTFVSDLLQVHLSKLYIRPFDNELVFLLSSYPPHIAHNPAFSLKLHKEQHYKMDCIQNKMGHNKSSVSTEYFPPLLFHSMKIWLSS